MKIVNTSDYGSIAQLVAALKEAAQTDKSIIMLVDGEPLMLLPGSEAREKLAGQIAQRLASNPTILRDLEDILENEQPEDWEMCE